MQNQLLFDTQVKTTLFQWSKFITSFKMNQIAFVFTKQSVVVRQTGVETIPLMCCLILKGNNQRSIRS